jgi:hypothetical protein
MNQQIMDMAQQEFNRAVMNNLGIYMIAEAWCIKPYQVVRHGNGYGLLTEGFVVNEIAKQIKEMKVGQDRMAATCASCGATHEQMWGSWVILGSGKLVCANDRCWRKAADSEKQKEKP